MKSLKGRAMNDPPMPFNNRRSFIMARGSSVNSQDLTPIAL